MMVVVKDSRWIVGEFHMSYGKIWCKKVRLIKKRIFGKGHQMTCVLQPQRERGGRDKGNFSSVLTSNVHFVRKGCAGQLKVAIFPQFLTSNVHFVRKGCAGRFKVATFPQFLTSNVHFVRKGCDGHFKIAILPRFWTSNVHFVRKGCVSWRSGGTAPALRENRRRARGDLQMWRCEDVNLQMWGCEDVDLQMWGCEDLDLQVWGCEDLDLQVWGCEDLDLQAWGVKM